MTKREEFKAKYKVDAFDLINEAFKPYLGVKLPISADTIFEDYLSSNYPNLRSDDDLIMGILETYQEAGEFFPFMGKGFEYPFEKLTPVPVNPKIPKSKGTLEDFKNIVGDDPYRVAMHGVYVAEDNALVGTDALKMIVFNTTEYHEYAGKIIDLTAFLKSKGSKIEFINETYPNYNNVIPDEFDLVITDIPTYAFYNLTKSYMFFIKLLNKPRPVIQLNLESLGIVKNINPVLLEEVVSFALKHNLNTFDLKYKHKSNSSPLVLDFSGSGIGLVMPVVDDIDAIALTIDEIVEKYGNPNIKTNPAKAPAIPKEIIFLEQIILKNLSPYK